MNMINVNEYLKLQTESHDNLTLIKKVGRIFCGPSSTMNKMFSLMKDNGIPVDYVNKDFVGDPSNSKIVKTFDGIQLRHQDFGFDSWSTVYTPVGYILKADNILSNLKQNIIEESSKHENVNFYENHSVVSIDRTQKTLTICDNYSGATSELTYDKMLLSAGAWTNRLLGPGVMCPPMSQLPVVVSNEQTQDFVVRYGFGF